jgi:hypothetical protein
MDVPVADIERALTALFRDEVSVRVSIVGRIDRPRHAKWKSIVSRYRVGG